MKLEAGHHLVRLETLTPANLGSALGDASLDRPTEKDAQFRLPFIPDSSLKGIWAGRYGDVPDEKENPDREPLFGSPDRGGKFGRPSKIVIGHGRLACFPLPTGGRQAWAAAAGNLLWALQSVEKKPLEFEQARQLLTRIELEGQKGRCCAVAWPEAPPLDALRGVDFLSGASVREGLPGLQALLSQLAAFPASSETPVLVASNRLAGILWPFVSEKRTLTAIGDNGAVESGTLRRIELIPPGTVFASLLTLLEDFEKERLPERLQVGAWKNLGLGWFGLQRISSSLAGSSSQVNPSGPAEKSPQSPSEAETMLQMWQAIEALSQKGVELKRAAKAAVAHFGPRAKFGGLEAAAAFSLAKARPGNPEPKTEALAHRWLLGCLLGLSLDPPQPEGTDARLLQWLTTQPFSPGVLEPYRGPVLTRWRWMRRYAELGLSEWGAGHE